jgi:hypothetical protein
MSIQTRPKHLQRYVDEMSWRFNRGNMETAGRMNDTFACVEGRMTYRALIRDGQKRKPEPPLKLEMGLASPRVDLSQPIRNSVYFARVLVAILHVIRIAAVHR